MIQFWKAEIKKISLKEGLYANLEDQSGHFTETKKIYITMHIQKKFHFTHLSAFKQPKSQQQQKSFRPSL